MSDILLVEDEALIRMMTAEMVEALGHRVVAQAGNLKDAEPLAASTHFDLAILDVNLGGHNIYPIALAVAGRDIPLLFASGYNTSGLPEPFHDRPILRKPFQTKELGEAINMILHRV